MAKIEIYNSYSQIKDIRSDDFKRLRVELSYVANPSSAYYSGGWVRKKYLLDKKGFFPTGLLPKVKDFFKNIPLEISDKRIKPSNRIRIVADFKVNLYASQIMAVRMALRHKHGGIVMPTGTGKSLAIASLIEEFSLRTLVVVPTLEIKKQLQEVFESIFGYTDKIVVENIGSSNLKQLTNFDMLIIDECHHAAAKTYQLLNKNVWKNIYYRFFFTATFFRNQNNEQLLFEGIAGKEIFRLTYKEAVKQKQIVPVEAYYIDVPKTDNHDCYTYREVYDKLVVKNPIRNTLISKFLLNLVEAKKSTLVLVKEIEHGHILSMLTGIPFVNGQDEETRKYIKKFNSREEFGLIGTEGILGEGVDTKPAEYILPVGLGKAKSSFMQKIGRGVRVYGDKESCKVILFRDASQKYLLKHFNEQKKICLEEYDIKTEKL